MYHSDVSGQSGSIARVTRSTAGRDLSRQLQPKTLTRIQESNDYVQPYAPDSSNRVLFLGQQAVMKMMRAGARMVVVCQERIVLTWIVFFERIN